MSPDPSPALSAPESPPASAGSAAPAPAVAQAPPTPGWAVRYRVILSLGLAVLVFALDQVTKAWILFDALPCRSGPPGPWCLDQVFRQEVTSFFNLTLTWNYGVTFGLLAGDDPRMAYGLSAVALAVVGGLVVWLRRTPRLIPAMAIGLIIGGAIGNVVDRLRFGAVVDFLDFHAFGWHWYIFNVADACIVLGVGVLLVITLLDGNASGGNARA